VLAQRVEILVEAVEQQETQAVPEVPEMLPNKVMLTRDLQERRQHHTWAEYDCNEIFKQSWTYKVWLCHIINII
jgi:hypothetical protein